MDMYLEQRKKTQAIHGVMVTSSLGRFKASLTSSHVGMTNANFKNRLL